MNKKIVAQLANYLQGGDYLDGDSRGVVYNGFTNEGNAEFNKLAAAIQGAVIVGVKPHWNGTVEILLKTKDGDLGVFAVIQDTDSTTCTVFEPLKVEDSVENLNCVISLDALGKGGNLND